MSVGGSTPVARVCRCRRVFSGLLVASIFLMLVGLALPPRVTAAETEEETEEEAQADEADRGFLGELNLGVELDLEFVWESQGDERASEMTFDEVGFALETEWWQAEMGIKYTSEGGGGILVEDAAIRLGGTETWPWFVTVGRTVLPFGEYDSRFVEDPLVTSVGETDEDAVILGFAGERLGIATGAFRGEAGGNHDLEIVISARVSDGEGSNLGLSWSSDVGEAVELREIREDAMEGEGDPASAQRSGGIGAFVTLDRGRWLLQSEIVSALASFEPGILDSERRRPIAWKLELAVRPCARWELAARAEVSADLPEAPERQFGLGAAYAPSSPVTVQVEYLRGGFEDGPDRDLVSAKLGFEF